MDVPSDDPRREQEGVYNSQMFEKDEKSIKIVALDTRYFRSPLSRSTEKGKRYGPATDSSGTVLGEQQWAWLEGQLNENVADFTVVVSSIQLLSGEHGFETWANFPKNVVRFTELLKRAKAKNVIVISGDRHISEFSKKEIVDLDYPLIDFTASGLTHSYTSFSGEPNRYRVGEVVSEKAFGLLRFDIESDKVIMQIMGEDGQVLGELVQQY